MGPKNEKVGVTAGLGIAILFTCGVVFAAEPSPVSSGSNMTKNGSDYPAVINGIRERAEAQNGKQWIETADAVLNQRGELEWARYLKTALKLPDWVDLGIENRTRFESLIIPWRSTQKIGRGQLILKLFSGPGCGLDWAMVLSDFFLKGRTRVHIRTTTPGISSILRRSTNGTFNSYWCH